MYYKWAIVTMLFCFGITYNTVSSQQINGGYICATCTVVIGLTEQLAEVHNMSIADTLAMLCNWLPQSIGDDCKMALEYLGPLVILLLENSYTPDAVCNALDICYQQDKTAPTCHLFPKPKEGLDASIRSAKWLLELLPQHKKFEKTTNSSTAYKGPISFPDLCKYPGIREICDLVKRVFNLHDPEEDVDSDGFSILGTLRGSDWRGKDCNDGNGDVYPGRTPVAGDAVTDSNCNGVRGTNPHTNVTFEEELCRSSSPRGLVLAGDSAGAHFHVPPEWLTATALNDRILKNLTAVIENEGDWPHMSMATGYISPNSPIIKGPVDSLYLRLRARNLCNHRDYQNLAVNGAQSFNIKSYQSSLSRNASRDYPVLMFYELIGNDVCNPYRDTWKHMTTPGQMRDNMLAALIDIDNRLPRGSHVVLVGLADGRILYEYLHNRTHPIGLWHNDVTYKDVYDWFNCLQVTPCYGWMSSDSWYRDVTSQRAKELSSVLRRLAKQYQHKFTNFDLYYLDLPINETIDDWRRQGGQPYQIIEPVDGFHPNQIAQALFAKHMWAAMEREFPEVLGPVNPNNHLIRTLFGDQGGH